MNDQMRLPELPPMQAATPSMVPAPPPSSPPAPPAKPGMGTKRLRQAIGYVATGGVALIAVVCGGELVLRDGIRPTDLMATIEARTELGIMNQKLGGQRGQLPLTEADYQEALAKAQRKGQADAEIGFQRELAAVQADKERVVGAYGALYQRTAIIAQGGVQMEQQALQFRQRLIEMTNGGRAAVLAVEDGLCGFGDANMCEKARLLRQGMIDESTELSEGDLAKKINALMAGIPDPATLVAREDQGRNGTPSVQR